VSRDHSLTEFSGETSTDRSDAESESSRAETDEAKEGEYAEGERDEASKEGEGETAPDPMVTTYRWSAEGETCVACGKRVEVRWRSEGTFACADCKEW
jgi:hypothetical protein